MIYEYKGIRPVIHPSAFVHAEAVIIGDVIIGESVYIAAGAVIRGDWGQIVIEKGCNVQENCTLHLFPNGKVLLKESAHIGHGSIIHGAEIGSNSLVGMNAVVMDNVIIGSECIIGALSFVKSQTNIPDRSLVVGNPAKIINEVSDEMIAWKTKGTQIYQQHTKECFESLISCEPLREMPEERKVQKQTVDYSVWTKK
jgi:carbonic anhydrase/acetyltransferase-like protein (isoleucine patch superfamily)